MSEPRSTGGRIRVLHVITDAGPHPYFDLIGAHADRERFDVRIATLGPAGSLHQEAERMGLPALAVGAGSRRGYARAVLSLARRLRSDAVDVLQTHLLDGSAVGLLAGRLARTPVTIMTAHHSHEIPLHDRRTLTLLDRFCAGPLCDAIIAPSAQMKETLTTVHRVPAHKVTVVEHGFELDRLDPGRTEGKQIRSELGLDGKLVIGSIGRLYWIKNQEALVRAFAEAARDLRDARLLFVGGGDPTRLLSLAGSLGIGDRVLVVPSRSDVPELLAAMDLFVHPALAESFAMVIPEAMAMARPVVSTPVGIAPDLIQDGATGVLAVDGSVEALTRALGSALEQRDRWGEMGREGRRRVETMRADRMVSAYEALYLRLLGEGAGSNAR